MPREPIILAIFIQTFLANFYPANRIWVPNWAISIRTPDMASFFSHMASRELNFLSFICSTKNKILSGFGNEFLGNFQGALNIADASAAQLGQKNHWLPDSGNVVSDSVSWSSIRVSAGIIGQTKYFLL
jgi:hypothetical protein